MTTTGMVGFYEVQFEEDEFTKGGGKCYRATDPALPGAVGYGATKEEAVEMLDKSREALLRTLAKFDQDRPFAVEGYGAIVQPGLVHA